VSSTFHRNRNTNRHVVDFEKFRDFYCFYIDSLTAVFLLQEGNIWTGMIDIPVDGII